MKLEINIEEYISVEELSQIDQQLVKKAKEACQRAYAPYSKFQVGAAALMENQEIITGNNQENSAYPSGICAERTTLYYAQSKFPEQKVLTIAIAAYQKGRYEPLPVGPCGACRQVMLETENRSKQSIRVILIGEEKIFVSRSVSDLLPLSFSSF